MNKFSQSDMAIQRQNRANELERQRQEHAANLKRSVDILAKQKRDETIAETLRIHNEKVRLQVITDRRDQMIRKKANILVHNLIIHIKRGINTDTIAHLNRTESLTYDILCTQLFPTKSILYSGDKRLILSDLNVYEQPVYLTDSEVGCINDDVYNLAMIMLNKQLKPLAMTINCIPKDCKYKCSDCDHTECSYHDNNCKICPRVTCTASGNDRIPKKCIAGGGCRTFPNRGYKYTENNWQNRHRCTHGKIIWENSVVWEVMLERKYKLHESESNSLCKTCYHKTCKYQHMVSCKCKGSNQMLRMRQSTDESTRCENIIEHFHCNECIGRKICDKHASHKVTAYFIKVVYTRPRFDMDRILYNIKSIMHSSNRSKLPQ